VTTDEYNDETKWTYYSPDGDATATFTPKIVKVGKYKVFEWHGADPQRDHATDAPYTINYAGGSKTIRINLDENIGRWNLLGTFRFKAGTSGNVTISNNANGNVVADAIKIRLHWRVTIIQLNNWRREKPVLSLHGAIPGELITLIKPLGRGYGKLPIKILSKINYSASS